MKRILDYIIVAVVALMSASFVVFLDTQIHPRPKEQEVVRIEAQDSLTDWQILQMALILTESKGRADAVGKNNNLGALQITPIYVDEANRIAGTDYIHEDALDLTKSLEMFDIVQSYRNPEHDIDKAIRFHNPGSKGYAYRQNMNLVRRMEVVRKAIKDNDR